MEKSTKDISKMVKGMVQGLYGLKMEVFTMENLDMIKPMELENYYTLMGIFM